MSKSKKDYSDRPYKVGKGKTPEEHKFKPGQSGNPKGRPKKDWSQDNRTIRDLFNEASNEMVKVKIDGNEQMVPKRVAITLRIMNDMLTATSTQSLKTFLAIHAIGAFDPSNENNMPDAEARQKFLQGLIDEHMSSEGSPLDEDSDS